MQRLAMTRRCDSDLDERRFHGCHVQARFDFHGRTASQLNSVEVEGATVNFPLHEIVLLELRFNDVPDLWVEAFDQRTEQKILGVSKPDATSKHPRHQVTEIPLHGLRAAPSRCTRLASARRACSRRRQGRQCLAVEYTKPFATSYHHFCCDAVQTCVAPHPEHVNGTSS
jgi:hypothetical protein